MGHLPNGQINLTKGRIAVDVVGFFPYGDLDPI